MTQGKQQQNFFVQSWQSITHPKWFSFFPGISLLLCNSHALVLPPEVIFSKQLYFHHSPHLHLCPILFSLWFSLSSSLFISFFLSFYPIHLLCDCCASVNPLKSHFYDNLYIFMSLLPMALPSNFFPLMPCIFLPHALFLSILPIHFLHNYYPIIHPLKSNSPNSFILMTMYIVVSSPQYLFLSTLFSYLITIHLILSFF